MTTAIETQTAQKPAQKFNLLDEPWIRVLTKSGEISMVNFSNAILRAHELRCLAGENAAQDLSVLRLLDAALLPVFFGSIDDPDDAAEKWKQLYDNNRFPAEPLMSYFAKWHDRFWLYDETWPFGQTVEMQDCGTTKQSVGVRKLRGTVLQSGNALRVKCGYSTDVTDMMTDDELARWLITLNNYDDNATKSGTGPGWLARFAAISAEGNTLFETLMLNLAVVNGAEEVWNSLCPEWENPPQRMNDVKEWDYSDDLALLYSHSSRQGCLGKTPDAAYTIQKGGRKQEIIPIHEPMSVWRTLKGKDPAVVQEIKGQMWRDMAPAITGVGATCGLAAFHGFLVKEKVLPPDMVLRYRVTNAIFSDAKKMVIADVRSDVMNFHAVAVSGNEDLRDCINKCINFAENVGNEIWFFALELLLLSGAKKESDKKLFMKKVSQQREMFFSLLDAPFRQKLMQMTESPDAGLMDAFKDWGKIVRQTCHGYADILEKNAGPSAQRGKVIDGKFTCSAQLRLTFNQKINELTQKEGI